MPASVTSQTRNHQELILAAQAGDRLAFDGLARRYRPLALALAQRLLNRDAAEDAVQDSMLIAFNAIGQLESPERFAPWFAAVIRNRCLRLARQNPKMASLDDIHEYQLAAPWTAALIAPPPELPEIELQLALQQLPKATRELVRLYYCDGMSIAEIATFLSLPATTIKWQLHAARAMLRNKLNYQEP